MRKIGLECPKAAIAETMEEALEIQSRFGFPVIIRPSFTMVVQAVVLHITAKNSLRFVNVVSTSLLLTNY